MNLLTLFVVLALLLWALWFVVGGLILGVRLLRRPPARGDLVPTPLLRSAGMVLLVGVLGVLVATALLTAVVVTEREVPQRQILSAIQHFDAGVHHLYDAGLAGLGKAREAVAGKSRQ